MPFIPEGSHDASQALSFKFPGFALIIVILLAFQCRKFLSLWDTINRHQPFSLWLNFQLCTLQLYLSSLLKNQWLALFPLMLNCNCLPWLGQSYFLLIVFGFFLGPHVSVPQCLLYVQLVSSLAFPCRCTSILSTCPVFLALAEFCILGYICCFVHLCFALFLVRCSQVFPSLPCIFVVPCAYISFVGVCSSPLCEIQGFFSVFCMFCLTAL